MESSILISTKKVLGLDAAYLVFDEDVLMHINAAFSIVTQLGVGPVGGFIVDDDTATWAQLDLPQDQGGLVKTYVYLKVKVLFDPPSTSFTLSAMENQIKEYEWRMNVSRETASLGAEWPPPVGGDYILDGGLVGG